MIDPQALSSLLDKEGFDSGDAAVPLAGYLDLLMRWNKVMNLVGAHSWQDALKRLIVDSFHLATFIRTLPLAASPLCWDLGSGAGLPGIPLRMLWQEGDYWLIEAREKRALFMSTALARHPLPGTRVFRGRMEHFFSTPQGSAANLVVSRAFMPWMELLAVLPDRLRPGGLAIFLLNELPDLRQLPAAAQWHIHSSTSYGVAGQQRHLCALQAR